MPTAKRATIERMNVAREHEFAEARRDLRGAEQRADRHHASPASMPARPKIASRCADRPDGTNA